MRLLELRTEDIQRLERLVALIDQAPTWNDCGVLLASGLRNLIDSDYCIYNETNVSGTAFTRQHVTEHIEQHESMMPVFYQHLPDHPVLANLGFQGLFNEVAQIADFSSIREYHNTSLYTDFYRHIGVDHQILTGLGVFGGIPVICCAHRARKTFTLREHQIFTALRIKISPVLQRKAKKAIADRRLNMLLEKLELHTGLTGLQELTLSEIRVAEHILSGYSYKEIAQKLHRSPRTIEKQAMSLLSRLGLERRSQLEAAFAAARR